MSQFKVTKQCIAGNGSECWNSVGEKYYFNAKPDDISYSFIDSSGMVWSMYWAGESEIFVDTNGSKKPNQWGKDRFAFYLYGADKTFDSGEIPVKVVPYQDNHNKLCFTATVCGSKNNYYGWTWLGWTTLNQ